MLESLLWKVGLERVAGADEVGVGPLAGAVVAAAVVFPPGVTVDGLADSKRLSPAAREELDVEIRTRGEIGLGVVEVEEIDRINIYQARMEALRRAVGDLAAPVDFVLVDGREIPHLGYKQSAYVKGDTFVASIAAASIVAKVHRDAYMRDLDRRYPAYGFARNMGYGTPAHIDALRRFGPSPVHRRSFRPQALLHSPLFAPSA
jgi:ribonuclease HII